MTEHQIQQDATFYTTDIQYNIVIDHLTHTIQFIHLFTQFQVVSAVDTKAFLKHAELARNEFIGQKEDFLSAKYLETYRKKPVNNTTLIYIGKLQGQYKPTFDFQQTETNQIFTPLYTSFDRDQYTISRE